MGQPNGFDVVRDEDIDQMITWARKDFRRLIESIRK